MKKEEVKKISKSPVNSNDENSISNAEHSKDSKNKKKF